MEFNNKKLKSIKGVPVNSVNTRTLSEIGFPVDVPKQPNLLHSIDYSSYFQKLYDSPYAIVHTVEKMYVKYLMEFGVENKAFEATLEKLWEYNITPNELVAGLTSGCVFSLSADDAKTLLEEFIYIVKELLPRQLSDIYYSFDIEPNPAHGVFYDLAVEKLNIPQETNRNSNNYGQFISHTADGAKQRILNGESFQSIYRNTCATKSIINDAFREAKYQGLDALPLRCIENAIFNLSKQYSYEVNAQADLPYDIVVYLDEKPFFAVQYLSEDDVEVFDDIAWYVPINSENVPLLVLDYAEVENGYISSIIRGAIKNIEYVVAHREERKQYFLYGRALDDCYGNWEASKTATLCGCFTCGKIFKPEEIVDFFDDDEACCPYCENTTVIMDSQGYEITDEYIQKLMQYVEEYEDD